MSLSVIRLILKVRRRAHIVVPRILIVTLNYWTFFIL